MTIAYLNKGKGMQYVQNYREFENIVTPLFAIYSLPSGKKFKLKIK